jgi:hypothetical protein
VTATGSDRHHVQPLLLGRIASAETAERIALHHVLSFEQGVRKII